MSLPRTVADVMHEHVTLELESLDRVYLNVYQPKLQTPTAAYYFLRERYGRGAVSSHSMKRITMRFLLSIHDYAQKHNVPVIRFATNRRVLHVQKTSQDFAMSEQLFREVTGRREVDGQRVSALGWGDPLVMALFSVLLLFRMLPCGFRSRDLREHLAPLLGDDPSQWTQGRRTYQLRRLRLHGLIARIPGTQRYQVTERGQSVALWCTRCHARLFRPGLGELIVAGHSAEATLHCAIAQFDRHVDRYLEKVKLKSAA